MDEDGDEVEQPEEIVTQEMATGESPRMLTLYGYNTFELVNELKRREEVSSVNVLPGTDYMLTSGSRSIKNTGPAIILVIID